MTFLFKCEKCGKELHVSVKIVLANQVVELSKDVKVLPITLKCPNCGEKASVKVNVQEGEEGRDRLAHLKFKSAQNPSMN